MAKVVHAVNGSLNEKLVYTPYHGAKVDFAMFLHSRQ